MSSVLGSPTRVTQLLSAHNRKHNPFSRIKSWYPTYSKLPRFSRALATRQIISRRKRLINSLFCRHFFNSNCKFNERFVFRNIYLLMWLCRRSAILCINVSDDTEMNFIFRRLFKRVDCLRSSSKLLSIGVPLIKIYSFFKLRF